jgi:hypothetical protein
MYSILEFLKHLIIWKGVIQSMLYSQNPHCTKKLINFSTSEISKNNFTQCTYVLCVTRGWDAQIREGEFSFCRLSSENQNNPGTGAVSSASTWRPEQGNKEDR